MRKGEPERKMSGKKRLFRDNSAPITSEKVPSLTLPACYFLLNPSPQALMKAQLRIVADKVDKKARGVTNSLAAYEGIIPDAPSGAFKKKKGKGKGSSVEKRIEGGKNGRKGKGRG